MNDTTQTQPLATYTSSEVDDSGPSTVTTLADTSSGERTFHCTERDHDVPISQALYPRSINPSICKECAAKRREANRQQAQTKQVEEQRSLDAIPDKNERGESKRLTISLTDYARAALEVMAVGRTSSDIVEDAIIRYLAGQDTQVIAFAGRVFTKKQ